MGYKTKEFTSSGLSPLHPAYYKEFQIVNWTCEDIVITDSNGLQTHMPKGTDAVMDNALCVVIEFRSTNGMRIDNTAKTTYSEAPAVPLKAQRITVPYTDIKQAPVKIEEFNCIISTIEQAVIAKNMMCEYNFGSSLVETPVDTQLMDPRLVFQVIDPNNEWDALLVNVFGQTIVLRSGPYSRLTWHNPIGVPTLDHGRLICYLRYPTDMYSGCKTRQVVFDISLAEIYKKEPFKLLSGDYVCVATCMEDLQEVLSKKVACSGGINSAESLSDKMIPKEVYEASKESNKQEIERINLLHRKELETLTVTKNTDIAKLKQELATVKAENESLKTQVRQWENLNEANTTFAENRQKVELAQEKTRREAADAARHDIDNVWAALKIGGTIAASVLSFTITVLLKTKK